MLLGCAATSPKVPENLTVDKSLPMLTGVEHISDINSVAFEWSNVKDPTIAGYIIYRGVPNNKLDRIAVVDNRFSTHFVDTKDLEPNQNYIYRFSLYTADGRESEATNNIAVKTKPMPEPVSFIVSVPNLPRMSKIIFRPHPSERIAGYIIERRESKDSGWKKVGELKGRLNAEFFDKDLKDNTEYEYRVIAKTHDGLLTAPSAIVITVTKPLPPMIANLNATSNLPKRIEIKWDRVANDQNGSYNLYASSYEKFGFSLLSNLKTNGVVEKMDSDGTTRYYKVTYIDADGLESPLQEKAVQGSTLGKPNAPQITKIAYENGRINLAWQNSDLRNIRFIVKKSTVSGVLKRDQKTFEIKGGESAFVDNDAKAGVTYQYTVTGVDSNGIESIESESARVTVDSSGTN